MSEVGDRVTCITVAQVRWDTPVVNGWYPARGARLETRAGVVRRVYCNGTLGVHFDGDHRSRGYELVLPWHVVDVDRVYRQPALFGA